MKTARPTVFVIDDDRTVLKALTRLLRAEGFEVSGFLSSREFLEKHDSSIPGCAVLDVAMPDLNGIELQNLLATAGCERFIIFITGHGSIPTSVQAMKAGAVDFLTKPFDDEDLLNAVRAAIEKDRLARRTREEFKSIEQRVATLTPRERQVLHRVVSGRLNKQIAFELGTAEKTVKVHRARVMQKMRVGSLAELVRVTEKISLLPNRVS
jgi:FixJ family two-component response regulator